MTAPIPRLKSAEVVDQVNKILRDITRFLPEDDLIIRRLLKEAETSVKANPAFGHAALASVYQLTGNAQKARHHATNAIELAPSEYVLLGNKSSILANLGFHSEALQCFQQAVKPERGQLSWVWPQGYVCGAFSTMVEAIKAARKMKLQLKHLDIETAEKAAKVIEETETSESTIAKVLDFIGAVLREHRLFYLGQTPKVNVFDEPGHEPFVRMVYRVALPAPEVQQIYREFIARVVREQVPMPDCLSVSLASSTPEHARKAA